MRSNAENAFYQQLETLVIKQTRVCFRSPDGHRINACVRGCRGVDVNGEWRPGYRHEAGRTCGNHRTEDGVGLGREPRVGRQRNLEHRSTDCIDLVTWGRCHSDASSWHDLDYDLEEHRAVGLIALGVHQINSEVIRTFERPIGRCNSYVCT